MTKLEMISNLMVSRMVLMATGKLIWYKGEYAPTNDGIKIKETVIFPPVPKYIHLEYKFDC